MSTDLKIVHVSMLDEHKAICEAHGPAFADAVGHSIAMLNMCSLTASLAAMGVEAGALSPSAADAAMDAFTSAAADASTVVASALGLGEKIDEILCVAKRCVCNANEGPEARAAILAAETERTPDTVLQ